MVYFGLAKTKSSSEKPEMEIWGALLQPFSEILAMWVFQKIVAQHTFKLYLIQFLQCLKAFFGPSKILNADLLLLTQGLTILWGN